MQRIAIFASGSGSNARKIMEHFAPSEVAEVGLVVSNRRKAGVLQIADEHGIDHVVVGRSDFTDPQFLHLLTQHKIDFIVLAGFLWLIPTYLVQVFNNRMVNIHPALLPQYGGAGMYGMHVHRAVKEAGEKQSGMTIHYVDEHYDEGQIIFQATCDLTPEDTPETIQKKVLKLEHQHFARVIEGCVAPIGLE